MTSKHPHIACIQMNSRANVMGNVQEADKWVAQASARGADLVVLPESFAFMGVSMQEQRLHGETQNDGVLQHTVSAMALRHRCWIVAGTLPIVDGGQLRAASLVYDEQGQLVARYDKIHLFDVSLSEAKEQYCESSVFTPGQEVVVIDSPVGRLGLSVCYDLRFPELFRQQMDRGMEVLVVPSAFTLNTGRAHWHCLLRARAIENLCYVAAAAQVGGHASGRETYGHSVIYDPWGDMLAEQESLPGVIHAPIDLVKQQQLRQEFPALQNRRL